METEIWKDIPGYENYYQASNLGNIKSLNYNRTTKEKLLNIHYMGKVYMKCALYIRMESEKQFQYIN